MHDEHEDVLGIGDLQQPRPHRGCLRHVEPAGGELGDDRQHIALGDLLDREIDSRGVRVEDPLVAHPVDLGG